MVSDTSKKHYRMVSWWITWRDLDWPSIDNLDRIRRRADKMSEAFVDTATVFGAHFRWDFMPVWPILHDYLATVAQELHQRGIRFFDHHSAVLVHRYETREEMRNVKLHSGPHLPFAPTRSAAASWKYRGRSLDDWRMIDTLTGGILQLPQYTAEEFCFANEEFIECYLEYVQMLVRDTGIDGLMCDDPTHFMGFRSCACRSCRARLRECAGIDLPGPDETMFWGNWENPAWKSWIDLRFDANGHFLERVRSVLPDHVPMMSCCSGSSAASAPATGQDVLEFNRGCNLVHLEFCGNTPPWNHDSHTWNPSISSRLVNSLHHLGAARERDFECIGQGYGFTQPVAEIIWALNKAIGASCWFSTLKGRLGLPEAVLDTLPDDAEPVCGVFRFEQEYPEFFNSKLVSQLAVLFPYETRNHTGYGNLDHGCARDFRETIELLFLNGITPGVVTSIPVDSKEYPLLLLPSAARLTNEEQSIKGFDSSTVSFGEMEFRIVDPRRNGKRAVLTFDSPHHKTELKSSEINVSGTYSYLYLLHAACWLEKDRATVGRIQVKYADRQTSEFLVESGHDINDWYRMFAAPNAIPVYWNDFSKRERGFFLSQFKLKSSEIQNIRFITEGGPVWILVAASLSDRKIDTAKHLKTIRFLPPHWKKADFPATKVVEGSALDLSGGFPAHQSGSLGRVIANRKGEMVFEKQPDKAIRFAGANNGVNLTALKRVLDKGSREEAYRNIDALVKRLQVSGYNFLRTLNIFDHDLYIESGEDGKFQAERLELFDYLVYSMKKNGMYLLGTIGGYYLGQCTDVKTTKAFRNDDKVKVFFGEPELRRKWENTARAILLHVNPHTGLTLKDDPVLFMLEPYNEQTLAIRHLFFKKGTIRQETLMYVKQKFSAFLKEKYGTPENLSASWGRNYSSFDEVYLFDQSAPGGIVGTDWENFVVQNAILTARWYREIIRQTGYPGLIAQYNYSNSMNFGMVRAAVNDAIIKNTYWAHPAGFAMQPGNRVNNRSSLELSGSYWRGVVNNRISGKPLVITEYNHCFWNRYGHEAGVLVPAYSALQGFSGLTIHSMPIMSRFWLQRPFDVGISPTMRANEFLSMMLFRRGDVAQSENHVEVVVAEPFLDKFENATQALNTNQNLLSLLCRFSVAFQGFQQDEIFPDALKVHPAGGAKIKNEEWFSSIENTDEGIVSLEKTVEEMRSRGILPRDNRTNIRNKIFQSDTGEIEMRSGEGLMKVITPRTEAVVMRPESGSERLKHLLVQKVSVPATVAVTSLDNRELPESSRLLLIVNVAVANTGMELSSDWVTLIQPGKSPVLLECVTLKAEISLDKSKTYQIFPLSVNGIRRKAVPVEVEAGILKLNLNTAELPNGPTLFFEIVSTEG